MANKYLWIKATAVLLAIMLLSAGCSKSGTATAGSDSTDSGTTASSTGGGIVQNPSSHGNESANESTEDDADNEEWKNTGTITLSETITHTGAGISVNGSVVNISSGGDFTVTGTLSDGMISIDTTEKVKLRLSGVNITNSRGPAIFFVNAKKAFITLTEGTTNNLTDGSKYNVEAKAALFSNDTLEIKGSGTLNVTGNYMHGIASDDDIIIENGTIVIKSATDALHANNNVTVNGGNITADSSSDGMESEGDIIINDGTLSISAGDDGIHAETELTVNGGKINITKSYEGLESKTTITIGGGDIRITASDDALNASSSIIINDGYIYADCEGDGYDSNSSMTINGGTTIIYSGNNANGPLDIGERSGGTFVINGGTVIASGGNMGISLSEESSQYSLWISSPLPANTLVNISAEDGSEIITFAPIKSSSLIFYSSDKLKGNATYYVSTGGSYSGKASDGVYSGGTYKSGSLLGTATMSSKSVSVGQPAGMGMRHGFGGGFGDNDGGKSRPAR